MLFRSNETNFVESLNKSNFPPNAIQMSTADIAQLEQQRKELAASFNDIATVLKRSSELAASFAESILGSDAFEVLQHLQQSADPAPTKGKRKAAVTEDEPLDGTKKRKRIIKPKDPNAPKRPASSYILYQNDVRKELKEQHPEMNNADLLTMISERWKNMTTEEKDKYNQENKVLTQQYSEEKKAYDNRTPEEVQAAKAAAEVALATKKEKKPRAPRTTKPAAAAVAPAVVPTPARPPPVVEASHSSGSEDSSDESDDEEPHPIAHLPVSSDSSDEESSEPTPKKRRGASAQPRPTASKPKKSSKV